MDCFVNFYLFTRHYVFRTIVQDADEFIVYEMYFTLFIYYLNSDCLKKYITADF